MSDPLRVTFIGRASEVGHAVPAAPADGLQASFVEHRPGLPAGRLLTHAAAHDPQVVVVFGVASVPAATVRAFDVPVVAWDVAPDRPPTLAHHPDLPYASAGFVADQATRGDYVSVVDRPLPVADELFVAAPRAFGDVPRALVVGHSSLRNEALLIDSKHRHEVLHIASGLKGDALVAALASSDIAVNVRDDDRPGFGPRVALYLAAGLLLLSEPLHPPCGLVAGTDHLAFGTPAELVELLRRVRAEPAQFTGVRAAGRERAEAFRASRVYGEVLAPVVEA